MGFTSYNSYDIYVSADDDYYYKVMPCATAYNPSTNEHTRYTAVPSDPVRISLVGKCTSFSASGITSTGFTLNWSSVSDAAGYELTRSADFWSDPPVLIGNYKGTSKTFTGLNPNESFTFFLRPYKYVDGVRVFGSSVTVSVTTALPAPEITSATRSGSTGASFNIAWAEMPGASGYQLVRSTSANGTYTTVCTTTKTTRTDSGLTVGTIYYYKVRAYRNVNGKTVYGDYSSPKVVFIPATPTGLRITASTRNSISLTWNKVPGTSVLYEVWRSKSRNSGYVLLGRYTGNTKVSSSLSPNTTYYYKVRAYYYSVDSDGTGHRLFGGYTTIISGTTKK